MSVRCRHVGAFSTSASLRRRCPIERERASLYHIRAEQPAVFAIVLAKHVHTSACWLCNLIPTGSSLINKLLSDDR